MKTVQTQTATQTTTRMTNFLAAGILGAVALAFGVSGNASACTFIIDDNAEQNDLIASAVSHLGLSLSEVSEIGSSAYSWTITKPTPMCPEEITHTAEVTFSYTNEEGQACVAELSVTKADSWVSAYDRYSFEGTPTCVAK